MKKKLNCKNIPMELYSITKQGELVEYNYVLMDFINECTYCCYQNMSTLKCVCLLEINKSKEFFVDGLEFYDNKKECIEDYLEDMKDERIIIDNEKEELLLKDANLKRRESYFQNLLNSLS